MYDHIKPWNLLLSPPSEANILIVSGWLNLALQTHLKKVYEQLKADKIVIAIGACQISGSVYHTDESASIDQILPVSVFVPGCPPSPEQIISGMKLALKNKNEDQNKESFLNVC